MSIALTEQQRQERVLTLIDDLHVVVATIEKLDQIIGGLAFTYTRRQYGSKVKAVREEMKQGYLKERKALMQKQTNIVNQVEDQQKRLEKPIVSFHEKK